MQNRDFDDYVVTGNNDNPAEIAVLKKGDMKQLDSLFAVFVQ